MEFDITEIPDNYFLDPVFDKIESITFTDKLIKNPAMLPKNCGTLKLTGSNFKGTIILDKKLPVFKSNNSFLIKIDGIFSGTIIKPESVNLEIILLNKSEILDYAKLPEKYNLNVWITSIVHCKSIPKHVIQKNWLILNMRKDF